MSLKQPKESNGAAIAAGVLGVAALAGGIVAAVASGNKKQQAGRAGEMKGPAPAGSRRPGRFAPPSGGGCGCGGR